MVVKKFVLHLYPDLDALGALWLMKRFGEKKFPNASLAPVEFWPIQKGKGSELEKQGIIALDFGRGRFDHHDLKDGEENFCATVLVVRELEIEDYPPLTKFLEFIQRKDVKGEGVKSKDTLDQCFHLVSIADGLNRRYANNPEKVQEIVFEIFDAYYLLELEWFDVINQLKNAFQIETRNGYKITLVYSESPKAARATRFQKFDACVIKDPLTHSITIQWNRQISKLTLNARLEMVRRITKQLRILEASSCQEEIDQKRLDEVGEYRGWFLHDSITLLLFGSQKNPPKTASKIPDQVIAEIVACGLDSERPFPKDFCLREECGESCIFYKFDFSNCNQFKLPSLTQNIEGKNG